jgi:nucleotide-binding universal stress UspA family protein
MPDSLLSRAAIGPSVVDDGPTEGGQVKTIIVGYDETDAAKRALARAADLAQAFGARVVVTSVARVLVPGPHGIGGIDPADPLADHEEQLDHAKAFLGERNVDAAYQTAAGDPAHTIVELAEHEQADLIIVGTREPGVLDRILNSSVSGSVARRAHCDVWIVH